MTLPLPQSSEPSVPREHISFIKCDSTPVDGTHLLTQPGYPSGGAGLGWDHGIPPPVVGCAVPMDSAGVQGIGCALQRIPPPDAGTVVLKGRGSWPKRTR